MPEIISGVKIDTLNTGINYRILCYGFDIENKRFNDFIRNTYNVLENINVKLISVTEKDYPNISLQEYLDYTYDRRGGFWKLYIILGIKVLLLN